MWDCVQTVEYDNMKETSLQIHTVLYLYFACKGKEYVERIGNYHFKEIAQGQVGYFLPANLLCPFPG